jgi:sec-independent protein translocase protein TatA
MLAEIFGFDGVIVVIVVGLVLFGSSQIPKLARSLGSAQKEFKQGLQEGQAFSETIKGQGAVMPDAKADVSADATKL